MGDLAWFGGPDPKPKPSRGGTGRRNRLRPTHADPATIGAILLEKTQDCRLCHTRQGVQAHHLIPRSKGGVWHLDNIVGLCSSCHGLVHGYDRAALYLFAKHAHSGRKGVLCGGWVKGGSTGDTLRVQRGEVDGARRR